MASIWSVENERFYNILDNLKKHYFSGNTDYEEIANELSSLDLTNGCNLSPYETQCLVHLTTISRGLRMCCNKSEALSTIFKLMDAAGHHVLLFDNDSYDKEHIEYFNDKISGIRCEECENDFTVDDRELKILYGSYYAFIRILEYEDTF